MGMNAGFNVGELLQASDSSSEKKGNQLHFQMLPLASYWQNCLLYILFRPNHISLVATHLHGGLF